MIVLKDIIKTYVTGKNTVQALDGVTLTIDEGEFVAIMGPSGSGKSTLMHIIGALDIPTSGTYAFDNEAVQHLSDDELADIRNRKIGFVFQSFNLLPRMSVLKNVALPLAYAGDPEREAKAKRVLATVGLSDKLASQPNELSGGQIQRVAIARALVTNPRLILADEPTGNLDRSTGREIMSILRTLNAERNLTIVMVTHDHALADQADRIVQLVEGRVEKV